MIKIALTNLGKYNEGELRYKWIELPASEKEIAEAMEEIGIREEYEEYFISDYESEIGGLEIDEYSNIDELNELAERLCQLGEYELEALEIILEEHGLDIEEALEYVEKGDYIYYENVESYEELADVLVEQGYFGHIPENLKYYLDYEKMGRNLEIEGWVIGSKGVLFLFN